MAVLDVLVVTPAGYRAGRLGPSSSAVSSETKQRGEEYDSRIGPDRNSCLCVATGRKLEPYQLARWFRDRRLVHVAFKRPPDASSGLGRCVEPAHFL
jgi:hypothetical protein